MGVPSDLFSAKVEEDPNSLDGERFAYVVNNYKFGFVQVRFLLVHIDKDKLYMWRFLMFNILKNYSKYMAQSYLTE